MKSLIFVFCILLSFTALGQDQVLRGVVYFDGNANGKLDKEGHALGKCQKFPIDAR